MKIKIKTPIIADINKATKSKTFSLTVNLLLCCYKYVKNATEVNVKVYIINTINRIATQSETLLDTLNLLLCC